MSVNRIERGRKVALEHGLKAGSSIRLLNVIAQQIGRAGLSV